MRKTIEISFYVLSGIFLYSGILCSFIEARYFFVTLIFLCILSLFAIITFFIGHMISKSPDWKRRLGIVIISSTCAALFAGITLFCFLNSQDFYQITQRNTTNIFNNYIQGILVTICFLISGWFLIKSFDIQTDKPFVGDDRDPAAPKQSAIEER